MFEPSSTVQILSSLSTRTECANSKPRNPLPISLMKLPVWSNSKSRLLLLGWKTKMWPLEFSGHRDGFAQVLARREFQEVWHGCKRNFGDIFEWSPYVGQMQARVLIPTERPTR